MQRKNANHPVIVVGALLSADQIEALKRAGADAVCDATPFNTTAIYHPYYGSDTQNRKDGAMTYYKLLLFNLTSLKRIVFFDADVLIEENPDYLFESTQESADIVAFHEGRPSDVWTSGFNTHIMLVKPSHEHFQSMTLRAATGNYRAFTNTEQDVIENEYAYLMRGFGDPGYPRYPQHQHNFNLDTKCTL